jgi:26S proteasome regulatory subunit N12
MSKELQELQAAYERKDWDACARLVPAIKLQLAEGRARGVPQEQLLPVAREMLELAVQMSVQTHDQAAFERNNQQLRQHYMESRQVLPPSQNEAVLTGLNLLRLLVQNRIAEFHTELEVIPSEMQQQECVRYIIQLEQWLMEGAYNKVLEARSAVPADSYSYFMDLLSATVRDEVAGCSERAYRSLTVEDAQRVLLMPNSQETCHYAAERGWDLREGRLFFQPPDTSGAHNVDALEIISNSMTYARELERIV